MLHYFQPTLGISLVPFCLSSLKGIPADTPGDVIRVIVTTYTPDCVSSLFCMSMTVQCWPLSFSAGFRWKMSLMALTSSVTLTKPLCCSGRSSPKSLWAKRSTGESPPVLGTHLSLLAKICWKLHRNRFVLKKLATKALLEGSAHDVSVAFYTCTVGLKNKLDQWNACFVHDWIWKSWF